MKKLLRWIFAAAALVAMADIAPLVGEALVGKARANTIRIGVEGAYPPFNTVDPSGNLYGLYGFDVDIAKALCERLQVRCVFRRASLPP